jgi:hypothetical protein
LNRGFNGSQTLRARFMRGSDATSSISPVRLPRNGFRDNFPPSPPPRWQCGLRRQADPDLTRIG